MNNVLIIFNPAANDRAAQRSQALREQLCDNGALFRIEVLPTDPGNVLSLASRSADVVVAVGYGPDEFSSFGQLSLPCLWDWGLTTMAQVDAWLTSSETTNELKLALAAAHGHIDVSEDIALCLEDALVIGISTHSIQRALAGSIKRTMVVIGEGLGNMIYATGLVRWLAARHGAPVDMLIHNRFDTAVSLFARAPWVNVIYPGFEYLAGRRYRLLVNTVTAGKLRPPFTAEQSLWLDDLYSYNLEGRFISEQELNFLGLDQVFDDVPVWGNTAHFPFIRDVSDAYVHPGNRLVGVAAGQKPGTWAKREWEGIASLVSRLENEGWDVRSFGLQGELVPGTKDYTGLPMREVVSELAKCSYFVSHDGGLFHVADGIGVPSLGLFGPSSRVKNGPFYQHSRTLSAQLSCSPCIYKIDWLRCQENACMHDLSVDQVHDALKALRHDIETNGYERLPYQVEETVLVHELGALTRAGSQTSLQQYVQERMGQLPQTAEFFVQYVVSSLVAGDIVGAAAIGEHMANNWPEDLAVRFLCRIIRQAHPGPTPLTDTRVAISPLKPEEMTALFSRLETLYLSPVAEAFLLQAGLRYWLQNDSEKGLAAFLAATAKAKYISKRLAKPLHRYLDRFLPEHVQRAGCSKDATSKELKQMQSVLRMSFKQCIDEHAQATAALLGIAPDELRKTGMTPYFVNAPRINPHTVELRLGDLTLELATRSTVLLLVPHVRVKDALAGSTSALIIQQARRLSALGMRPVVVTTGYGDVGGGWLLRDSVTYIQAHPYWDATQWLEVFSYFDPALCLTYADAAIKLDLPEKIALTIIEISCEGLFDPQGIYYQFDRGNRWGCRSDVTPTKRASRHLISSDQLSETLFYRTESPYEAPASGLRVLALAHDPQDFVALCLLMQAMPSVAFTVISDFVYRGAEKNVCMLSLAPLSAKCLENADCLLQFSTKPSVLSAEAIMFMEHGKAVVAATIHSKTPTLDEYYFRVTDTQKIISWITAVKTITHRM